MPDYTYRLKFVGSGYLAECCEVDAAAEGSSEDEAISSLRRALALRLREPNAVAPPSTPRLLEITLSAAPEHEAASPQGPGEAM